MSLGCRGVEVNEELGDCAGKGPYSDKYEYESDGRHDVNPPSLIDFCEEQLQGLF